MNPLGDSTFVPNSLAEPIQMKLSMTIPLES